MASFRAKSTEEVEVCLEESNVPASKITQRCKPVETPMRHGFPSSENGSNNCANLLNVYGQQYFYGCNIKHIPSQ